MWQVYGTVTINTRHLVMMNKTFKPLWSVLSSVEYLQEMILMKKNRLEQQIQTYKYPLTLLSTLENQLKALQPLTNTLTMPQTSNNVKTCWSPFQVLVVSLFLTY